MPAIAFSRAIGPVPIDCIVSEKHESDIEITEIPIETGARITDHAFVLPKKVTLDIATSNAAASYNALVGFQESRVPFTLVTDLSIYNSMLIRRISAERDATFSTILRCTADLQEIIIVGTATVADPEGQKTSTGEPGGTNSTKSAGASPERAGDAVTADRATGTVQRGDAATTTVPAQEDRSILSRTFAN